MVKEIDLSKALNKQPSTLEQKILCAIFKRNNCLADIVDIVTPQMFSISDYASIYQAMIDIYKDDDTITPETVQIKLENNGAIIDPKIIEKLYNEAYTSLKIKEVALVLKELYQRRYILQNIREICDKQDEQPTPSDDILEQVNNVAISASDKMSRNESASRCFTDINSYMLQLNNRLKIDSQEEGILTGWTTIDLDLGGFKRGNLICLCASSSAGKSWIALETCVQMCLRKPDLKVLYFSLEMTKQELEQRMLSIISGISTEYLERPKLYFNRQLPDGSFVNMYDQNPNTPEVIEFKNKIKNALDILHSLNITIDDEGGLKIDDIMTRINRYALKNGGIDAIYIDHTYLLRNTNVDMGTSDEFGDIYYRLKNASKKYKCITYALHQLNFEVKNNSDRRPSIYNIRGSSQIIDNCDIVMLLYNANIHHDLIRQNPELKDTIDITFGKVRAHRFPQPIELKVTDTGAFIEKESDETKGNIIKGRVYIDSDGNVHTEIEDE